MITTLKEVCIIAFVSGLALLAVCEIFPDQIVTAFGINDELHDFATITVMIYMLC